MQGHNSLRECFRLIPRILIDDENEIVGLKWIRLASC